MNAGRSLGRALSQEDQLWNQNVVNGKNLETGEGQEKR